MFGSCRKTLIISNEEMTDIMKIVDSLEGSSLLIKGGSKTIENETKTKRRILRMLLDTLGARNLFIGKSTIRRVEDTARAGQNF